MLTLSTRSCNEPPVWCRRLFPRNCDDEKNVSPCWSSSSALWSSSYRIYTYIDWNGIKHLAEHDHEPFRLSKKFISRKYKIKYWDKLLYEPWIFHFCSLCLLVLYMNMLHPIDSLTQNHPNQDSAMKTNKLLPMS